MDVDPAPVVRDKKRFEVKKVSIQCLLKLILTAPTFIQWNAVALWAWGE